MGLKFRLRGLAETMVDYIRCPECGSDGVDDSAFATEQVKVTFEGIAIIFQCRCCGEIFVPDTLQLGVQSADELKAAVERDAKETGQALHPTLESVVLSAEHLNAVRRGCLH
jgi:uncharacterized Zn finger protein